VAGSCEYGVKHPGSRKGGVFLTSWAYNQRRKKQSAPRS
jgi:hypothetical protein